VKKRKSRSARGSAPHAQSRPTATASTKKNKTPKRGPPGNGGHGGRGGDGSASKKKKAPKRRKTGGYTRKKRVRNGDELLFQGASLTQDQLNLIEEDQYKAMVNRNMKDCLKSLRLTKRAVSGKSDTKQKKRRTPRKASTKKSTKKQQSVENASAEPSMFEWAGEQVPAAKPPANQLTNYKPVRSKKRKRGSQKAGNEDDVMSVCTPTYLTRLGSQLNHFAGLVEPHVRCIAVFSVVIMLCRFFFQMLGGDMLILENVGSGKALPHSFAWKDHGSGNDLLLFLKMPYVLNMMN
jgi:hypothetical protein